MKKLEIKTKILEILKSPNTWRMTAGIFFLCMATTGYCNPNPGDVLEAQTASIMDTIFSKGIRSIFLLFGMTAGFIMTFLGGNFKPLILYGGIGCMFFFIPKIILLIQSIKG